MGRVRESVDGKLLRGIWLSLKSWGILAELESAGQVRGLVKDGAQRNLIS